MMIIILYSLRNFVDCLVTCMRVYQIPTSFLTKKYIFYMNLHLNLQRGRGKKCNTGKERMGKIAHFTNCPISSYSLLGRMIHESWEEMERKQADVQCVCREKNVRNFEGSNSSDMYMQCTFSKRERGWRSNSSSIKFKRITLYRMFSSNPERLWNEEKADRQDGRKNTMKVKLNVESCLVRTGNGLERRDKKNGSRSFSLRKKRTEREKRRQYW